MHSLFRIPHTFQKFFLLEKNLAQFLIDYPLILSLGYEQISCYDENFRIISLSRIVNAENTGCPSFGRPANLIRAHKSKFLRQHVGRY